jgi:signal transduction histidine kinase
MAAVSAPVGANSSAAALAGDEPKDLREIEFSVDSALLQELGERLVGQSHIALAELIKNSYDADATLVEVVVRPDSIVVSDDGHGMDFKAFRDFWMRIGSQHKDQRRGSPGGRRLTGSKGVGRLSAQFLANRIRMTTRAEKKKALFADVDWRAAIKAHDLTKATARWAFVPRPTFAGGASHGTSIRLFDLKQEWDREALRALARELWPLQPPYAIDDQGADTFRVALDASDPVAEATFSRQMRAVLELWTARIVGSIGRTGKAGKLAVRVQFRDDEIVRHTEKINGLRLETASFEIRVFDLKRRQPHGIKVEEARGYLNDFGGVHVYDAGFHLPYYGPHVDWLGIERDHSHRLSRSELLPEDLQIGGGLNFLPTNTRLYGVVRIDTGAERAAAVDAGLTTSDVLAIQISRDRLIDNKPYAQLRDAVRWSLDLYAMEEARRRWNADAEPAGPLELTERAARVEDVLDRYADRIPSPVLTELRTSLADVTEQVESEAQQAVRQAGVLGALATAGISAIAVEHETGRQIAELRRLTRRLRKHAEDHDDEELRALSDDLSTWTQTIQSTRALFGPFMDEESREKVQRLSARSVIQRTVAQSALLLRGVAVDDGAIPKDLDLPPGRFAEWVAIFQNLLVNAANATLDRSDRRVAVRGYEAAHQSGILVEDTGSGVDLDEAEDLFAPFTRRQSISPERRALGAGGTGLGLTIARMIARNLGCQVAFVVPDSGFSTAVNVSWRQR